MKFCLPVLFAIILFSCTGNRPEYETDTAGLLNEMTDLQRLASLPRYSYKEIQFSSYDRRSTRPSDSCWFANEDGFGSEPVPGFQKVLREPDANGTGEYLICDVKGPGAIVRLWTAGLNGKIRLFLDNFQSPVYEGDAQDFFWKTAEVMSGSGDSSGFAAIFRQFDASYFPIPFSGGCRIEWIGDIGKIHFYHVGMRIFDHDMKVKTFRKSEFVSYRQKIEEVGRIFASPGLLDSSKAAPAEIHELILPDSTGKEIYYKRGSGEITFFSLKLSGGDPEAALRKSILSIFFDDSSVPQVEAPAGDFFGSAPGLNPYNSLPFTVRADGLMICRFIMPFGKSVRIELHNYSGQSIKCSGALKIAATKWEPGRSMHFRARWTMDHGITAAPFDGVKDGVQDILYLMASGKGRIVGTGAFIFNPSNATTSWGNWWGEGDEKIFVDADTFPSFFGTGSEDYFNYSWSSAKIFSFPYCGQTRNDGPGNRGYVSDFRWHITDDILFRDKTAFYMELGHHGIVPGFSYGRIVYFYSLPGALDNYRKISVPEIKYLPYPSWEPIAYLGSAGFTYIQSEKLMDATGDVRKEKGKLWAGGNIMMWTPGRKGEKIAFSLPSVKDSGKAIIGLTLSHEPDGGKIAVSVNGTQVKFDGSFETDTFEPVQTILANHFSEPVRLRKGLNRIEIESVSGEPGKKTGIDFVWLKAP